MLFVKRAQSPSRLSFCRRKYSEIEKLHEECVNNSEEAILKVEADLKATATRRRTAFASASRAIPAAPTIKHNDKDLGVILYDRRRK